VQVPRVPGFGQQPIAARVTAAQYRFALKRTKAAEVSDQSEGPGWWLASDGKWYPPESLPRPASPSTGADESATSDRTRPPWKIIAFGLAAAGVIGIVLVATGGGGHSPDYEGYASYINATAPNRADNPITVDELAEIHDDDPDCPTIDDTLLTAEQMVDDIGGQAGDVEAAKVRIARNYFFCGESYATEYVRKKYVGASEGQLLAFVDTLDTYGD